MYVEEKIIASGFMFIFAAVVWSLVIQKARKDSQIHQIGGGEQLVFFLMPMAREKDTQSWSSRYFSYYWVLVSGFFQIFGHRGSDRQITA